MVRRPSEKSKCTVCIKSLKNDTDNIGAESELVKLKNKEFSIHPNCDVFKILYVFETWFRNLAGSNDVFDNIYYEF